jgi:hypothetical protein
MVGEGRRNLRYRQVISKLTQCVDLERGFDRAEFAGQREFGQVVDLVHRRAKLPAGEEAHGLRASLKTRS